MSNLGRLAEINKLANKCIADRNYAQEAKFHNEFMKIAQIVKNEENTYRANGPNMERAIKVIQKNLGITADGLFGPSTAYAIVKALDGIAPETTLDKEYVKRARLFVQSLPAGFVTRLKNLVGMKADIRALENVPATRTKEIEFSDVKMRLIEFLGGYTG